MGAHLDESPAAMTTAFLTRYGSSASNPVCVRAPSRTRPASSTALSVRPTEPEDNPVLAASARRLDGAPDARAAKRANSLLVTCIVPPIPVMSGSNFTIV